MKINCFVCLFFLLFLFGCVDNQLEVHGPPVFGVSQAQTFFEENATDLRGVSFVDVAASKSVETSNIVPDWKKARITQEGRITTIEVPLSGAVCKAARTFMKSDSETLYGFTSKVTMRLIVQKHTELDLPRQFVVTMIEDLSHGILKNSVGNCYGPNNFTGYVIVSSLDGFYLESFKSDNGHWDRVYMAPGSSGDLDDNRNVGIRLFGSDIPFTAYNIGEGGTSICPGCGNFSGMCTCCKKCGGRGCSDCMVTVYPTCPRCGYTGRGNCNCCPDCRNFPCTCLLEPQPEPQPDPDPVWRCPHCGSQYCGGNCQISGGDGTDTDECPHKECPGCGKMIGIQTKSSVCDSHEYCENNGKCIRVDVRVSKNQVELGGKYMIELELTPADAEYAGISYYIVKGRESFVLVQPEGGNAKSLENMARTAGRFLIKAEVMEPETGKEFIGTCEVEHLFPLRDEILKQPAVIKGMDEAWQKTLAAVNSSTVQEYGGVVVINTKESNTGGLYSFLPREGKPTAYSDTIVSVDLKYVEENYGPYSGGVFAVLLFHTHPPFWGYKGTVQYDRAVGPSVPDIKNHVDIPAVVKDFAPKDKQEITTKMSREEYEGTEKLYHYGPDRRENIII